MTATSTVAAWVVLPNGETVLAKRCELAMDRAWSPYAQAVVTVPWTAERAVACDPRDGNPRVRIGIRRQWYAAATLGILGKAWGGLTLADVGAEIGGATLADLGTAWSVAWNDADPWREPDELMADLVVRARAVDVGRADLVIRAATDELLAKRAHAAITRLAETERTRIVALLTAGGVPVVRTALTVEPTEHDADALTVPITQSVWAALEEQVVPWQRRLWCDLDRTWHTEWAFAAPSGTVHVDRATVVDDTIDVDYGWADSIVVTTRGMISDPETGQPTAAERVDTWPPGPLTGQVVAQTRDLGATPQASMGTLPGPDDDELAARLARLQEGGRTLTITAPILPTLRPGVALTTGAPSMPALAGVVTAVRFNVPEDTVTITAGAITESET